MTKYWAGSIIFLIFCGLPNKVIARNFPLVHYTVDDGLPSNTVYAITKDHFDFLWFSTDKGVARFNGIEFEKFNTSDGLPDNDVFWIQEDNKQRLWTNCYSGKLCYFSYEDGKFHNQENTPFLKIPFKHSFLTKIETEKDSSLTFLFFDNCFILNIRGNRINYFYLSRDKIHELAFPGVISDRKISDSQYQLFLSDVSYIVDTNCNVIATTSYRNAHYSCSLFQGQQYFYSSEGIFSLNEELLYKFTNKGLIGATIYRIIKFGDNWFICTNVGLFVNNDLQILNGQRISSVNQDREGNYWISTLNNGVYYLAKDFLKTEQYDDVYSGYVEYARATGNNLFFTTNNRNLYRFERSRSVLLFDYYKKFARYYASNEKWQNFINGNYNYGKFVDDAFRYYNLDDSISFTIDDVNTDHPKPRFYKRNSELGHVKEVIECGKNLIIRNSDFISVIDKSDLVSNGMLHVKKIGENIPDKRIFGFSADANGAIWYSTFDSVYKITDTTAIQQRQFGNFAFKWMQIVGKYLVGISYKNQLVVCNNFDANIRFASTYGDYCTWDKLYKLNDSTFLVSTDNQYRLLHLYPSADTPRIKIQVIENTSLPMQAEYICSNDSFCYFFKKGSLTRIPVSDLFIKHMVPDITFKFLKTRNKSYPIKSGMEIKYSESKNINISFAPFSFGSKNVLCEYSISQNTGDYWRQVRGNEINLFDPGYGNYVVKVRARVLSGDFGAPAVFNFTIVKPFWATWWFIILAVSFFVASVSGIIRAIIIQRARKREIKHENEIKFLRSEYKALNALMNPHFIFNTLNNVQWLVSNDDRKTAIHYLRVFSDLVRQNMHNISKELIPLNNEIELVRNYLQLEKLRFKEALNYEINIEDGIDLDGIKIPPLLIQPLVENAIKHGLLPGANTTDNLLKINIYREPDKLHIDILDNGIGFSESQKKARTLHKSTGIENIRKRIEKLSMMHDVAISLVINDVDLNTDFQTGTLARISMDINEE